MPLDGRSAPTCTCRSRTARSTFSRASRSTRCSARCRDADSMLELQLTQEYLGQGTHLAYLAPLFKEVLDADTFARGPGSTVARVVDGSLRGRRHGHPVRRHRRRRQHRRRPQLVRPPVRAGELVRLRPARLGPQPRRRRHRRRVAAHDVHARRTLRRARQGDDAGVARGGRRLHDAARPAPHHGRGPPPRPRPWVDVKDAGRADWTSVYYHRADADGIGFDRTATGSDAVVALPFAAARAVRRPRHLSREPAALVPPPALGPPHVARAARCGTSSVTATRAASTPSAACRRPGTPSRRSSTARATATCARLLAIQEQEARWWRNACLLYFQTFSRRPLPAGLEPLAGTLDDYRQIRSSDHGVTSPTNVVTERAGSVYVNAPSTTDTARLRLQVLCPPPSPRASSSRDGAARDREVLTPARWSSG